MKLEFPRQIIEKFSDINFHEKFVQWEPSCSVQTDTHGQTDMTKLIVAVCNFANTPNIVVPYFVLSVPNLCGYSINKTRGSRADWPSWMSK